MIPPLLCRLTLGSKPRGRFSLWLPLFLLWPLVFLLVLPVLLVLMLVLPWFQEGRLWLRAGACLYQALCSCRGLSVDVQGRQDLVSIAID